MIIVDKEKFLYKKRRNLVMNVAKFFTKDNIVLDLKATNKEEAIF